MQNWSDGVELELHGVGAYRTVRSTEDAARCLLAHWPRGKGRAYVAAQQACLAALEGRTPPEAARAAFIRAARAARIHIRTLKDPRAMAMKAGRKSIPKVATTDAGSKAWRQANSRAMAGIKAKVARSKPESAGSPEPGKSGN